MTWQDFEPPIHNLSSAIRRALPYNSEAIGSMTCVRDYQLLTHNALNSIDEFYFVCSWAALEVMQTQRFEHNSIGAFWCEIP